MTDEREPLWSDIRIRDRYHALVPCEANMGEMEYWNVLRDVGERVSYELRNDYEVRIAELETQVAGKEELIVQLVEIDMPAMEDVNERLEARLAQTWQPLPDGTYHTNNAEIFRIVGGDMITYAYGSTTRIEFYQGQAICRLVERAEPQPYLHRNGETEPPTVAGRYWFDGYRTKSNGNRAHVMDMVETNERGSVYNDVDGLTDEPHAYKGKWYGPIVAPWEDCHE